MSGEGKRFVIKKAQEAATNSFKINPDLLNQNNTFVGTVSADLSYITDSDGNVYPLVYTGNPQPKSLAYKLQDGTAFVQGPEIFQQFLWQDSPPAYVLSRDSTYVYIRKLGSSDKYYMPIASSMAGKDFTKFQTLFSSDGKAVLLGTITQNNDGTYAVPPALLYDQIARYAIFKNFSLVDYTTEATADLDLSGLTYPVGKDQGFKIAFFKAADIYANYFNINDMSDGNVPAPAPNSYGAKSLFFPNSDSHSLNFSFALSTEFQWDQDSGSQFWKTDLIPGAQVDHYVQKKTKGDNTLTWQASPNSSIFKNYFFTFNNDLDGNYNADLVCTFVNCYFFGLTDFKWITSFESIELLDYTVYFVGNGVITIDYAYDETRELTFSYKYPEDFAYTLQYFASPDIWLPINVTPTTLSNSWIKNISALQDSTVPGNVFHYEGKAQYDPNTNTYISTSGSPAGYYYSACQFAFSYFYTIGPPGPQPPLTPIFYVNPPDFTKKNYYTGLYRTYKDYFNVSPYINAGIYIHYPGTGSFYDFADLNYDNAFPTAAPSYFAAFGGRSSMVVNNLAGTPMLYGIITQPLGDGKDFNSLQSVFRGRNFIDNSNTAFIYKQDFNQVLRYSSPWLQQGNLSDIQGTGQASLSDQNTDGYTDAIVELVDWQSLADAYGNSALVAKIGNLISVYRAQSVPTRAQIDSVIDDIIALDSSFTAQANATRSRLYIVNDGLNGDTTVLGVDVIGFKMPDVYSDKIFSAYGTWPFEQPGGGYLKAVDSYIVSGYYTDNNQEVIQHYNVDTTGLTTKGKKTSKSLKATDAVLDYVLPLKNTSTIG